MKLEGMENMVHEEAKALMNKASNIIDVAKMLNTYVESGIKGSDTGITLLREVCPKLGWTFVSGEPLYNEDEYVSDGEHILVYDDGWLVIDERPKLKDEIAKTGYRYRDNDDDGTFDVCYDHRADSWFDTSVQATAVVAEDANNWLVDAMTGFGIGEYPKKDWSLMDAIRNYCGGSDE